MISKKYATGQDFQMPILGQGTWMMAENPSFREAEIAALRYGISLGINLIDSAEMYGEGSAETLAGEAIRVIPRRELFLVSKVYPQNATKEKLKKCCEASLQRLGTDYLDLYLLHWKEAANLHIVVDEMENLVTEGKIRNWGVSNFDTHEMEELWAIPKGSNCKVNQVLYNLGSRGIEYDLLPWMKAHEVVPMAYCPIAQGGSLRKELLEHPAVLTLARKHQTSLFQILLAFVLSYENMVAIPKAVGRDHVLENARATKIKLSEEDITTLNKAFPAPTTKVPLEKV